MAPPPPPIPIIPVKAVSPYMGVAEKVMLQCDELGTISSMFPQVCRLYLTPEHAKCNKVVAGWMETAGMETWQDQAGNIWGRYRASESNARTLVLGSHLDTVPNAGKYDGVLGVLVAIEAINQLHDKGIRLPFNVDIVGFGDEEGSRFGTTLLGSRAVAGTWKPEWMDLVDKQSVKMADALKDFGCDPELLHTASRTEDDIFGYMEVHIEQGPMLEGHNQPLGIVPSIAGARRFLVTISGKAGHAGTVPMNMRQDALVAAASAVHMVEQIANRFQIVATVGQLQCYPGAPNVIPGSCQFSIDIRSGRDQTRDVAVDTIQKQLQEMVDERRMTIEWKEIHSAPAVECASWIQRLMEDVAIKMDLEPLSIVSGAGHDAMSIAEFTDIGMLFVRCGGGGISHHPDESVITEDVAVAIDALGKTLVRVAEDKLYLPP